MRSALPRSSIISSRRPSWRHFLCGLRYCFGVGIGQSYKLGLRKGSSSGWRRLGRRIWERKWERKWKRKWRGNRSSGGWTFAEEDEWGLVGCGDLRRVWRILGPWYLLFSFFYVRRRILAAPRCVRCVSIRLVRRIWKSFMPIIHSQKPTARLPL